MLFEVMLFEVLVMVRAHVCEVDGRLLSGKGTQFEFVVLLGVIGRAPANWSAGAGVALGRCCCPCLRD